MKKLIALLLALVLLVPAVSLADFLDVFGLSPEELQLANEMIQLRLFTEESAVNGVRVPSGTYTVGVDIPAGTYRIEYKQMYDTDFCSFLATNEKELFGFTTILGFSGSSEIGKIELTDETKIEITGGDVYFYTYTGLFH